MLALQGDPEPSAGPPRGERKQILAASTALPFPHMVSGISLQTSWQERKLVDLQPDKSFCSYFLTPGGLRTTQRSV